MTLLVAQTDGSVAWMVADTAISSPLRGMRERRFMLKVEPGQGMSLLGYADNADRGALTVRQAASLPPGRDVLKMLLDVHTTHRDVEFAYAFVEDGTAVLYKIADGVARSVPALYLGDADAYEAFQAIRHAEKIDHAPDAMHLFIAWVPKEGLREPDPPIKIPKMLTESIKAMQTLFVQTSERGVGGVAIPFILSHQGPQVLNYVYAVSDPLTRELAHGTVVPHGTAERGGYGISVSQLAEKDGVFVYWLQRPGGTVFIRREGGDDVYDFEGRPGDFVQAVKQELDRDVSLFFGEVAPAEPHSLRLMFDENGVACLAVASSDIDFTFSWLHMSEDSFRMVPTALPVGIGTQQAEPPVGLQGTITNEGKTLSLTAQDDNGKSVEIPLAATQVDQLIRHLSQLRASMTEKVPSAPDSGVYPVSLDPTWRTNADVHPAFPGVCLALRDDGLGWHMYWLPPHEVRAVGEYLASYEKGSSRTAQGQD